ncbi:hypothetical protein PROFUN_11432 [Planoprotostelium fungivorum]|uniref:Uncharacterized protein n=1 Tax=Planoprotostelium fungivorum TaxID=1890364 RepID=A0A2P6NAA4_9EUKA|nr:hypothetical protein PROFUN_11432 [Planoprotostelium fungivorum]
MRQRAREDDQDDVLFDPDMFINRVYATETFHFKDKSVTIKLSKAAAIIWPAAAVLCRYIEHYSSHFTDSVTLELGAGVGLCGVLMAQYCTKTVLSDYQDIVLELLKENAEKNTSEGHDIECSKLDWSVNLEEFSQKYPDGFDFVFGSDIIFWRESNPFLLKVVHQVLNQRTEYRQKNGIHSERKPQFLLTYYQRSSNCEDALKREAVEMGLNVEDVPLSQFIEESEVSNFSNICCLIFTLER